MTGRYTILQTKLKELESIVSDALLHGPEDQNYSHNEDIKQKLAFIGNLLSAEVASHPSRPHHLLHIADRLALLEKAFYQWDTHRTFSSVEDFDKDSNCSCTESCLNDDGGEALNDAELIVFDDPEKLFPDDFVGEKAIVEFRGNGIEKTGEKISFFGSDKFGSFDYQDAEDEDEFFEDLVRERELVEFHGSLLEEEKKGDEMEREEEGRGKSGGFGKKNCCAMAGGVVIGMILMGFIMVDLFGYVEQQGFAIPT